MSAYRVCLPSKIKKYPCLLGVLFISFIVTGCVGIGVVSTSDPMQKLNDAEHLFNKQDRPLLSEGLIIEAIEIFEVKPDYRGLGHAYRTYGDFLRSDSVARYQHIYKKNGFMDKTITMDNRFIKVLDELLNDSVNG